MVGRPPASLEDFVQKARKLHGSAFDYDHVVYQDSRTKVEISCATHGTFLQTPKAHLQGQGCPQCRLKSLGRKLSLEEFKQRLAEIHGDKYSFTESSYIDTRFPVTVICSTHGEVQILANSLLRGSGCRRCAMAAKKMVVSDGDSFAAQARLVHGDRYDYSKVVYNGTKQKSAVICSVHGEFLQSPEAHLQGRGCPQCAHSRKSNVRVDDAKVIKELRSIHGDKYQYMGTVKIGRKRFIRYICQTHGEVEQEVRTHRTGATCPQCWGRDRSTKEFIVEARLRHGDKYDYSQVNYSLGTTPVAVICPMHGAFTQTPAGHLAGYGCPRCGVEQRAEKSRMTTDVFLIKAKEIHGAKYQYPDLAFSNGLDYIKIICPVHGEFRQQVGSHINQESGCPKCWRGFSRGEERIEQILSKKGVAFVRQQTFGSELVSSKGIPLRFDFYLPTFNMIIEYDGAQHFVPFPYSNEEDEESVTARFHLTVPHDEIKNEFARTKGISMVRISYLEFKNLEVLVNQALGETNA